MKRFDGDGFIRELKVEKHFDIKIKYLDLTPAKECRKQMI